MPLVKIVGDDKSYSFGTPKRVGDIDYWIKAIRKVHPRLREAPYQSHTVGDKEIRFTFLGDLPGQDYGFLMVVVDRTIDYAGGQRQHSS